MAPAHTAHPMREFRTLISIVRLKKRRAAHRGGVIPHKDVDTPSLSTQDSPDPVQQKLTYAIKPAVDDRKVRDQVNGENAIFYDRNLDDADDLRLLRIEPGSDHEPIKACLEYTSMAAADLKPYDALSYCWGAQTEFPEITVDGNKGFQVSKHLYNALRRLRKPDRSRLMWIDVICVNQDNIPERNRSVSLIWKIYSKARRVCVWIGDAKCDAEIPNCPRRWPNLEDGDDRAALCAKDGIAAWEHGNLKRDLSERLQEMELFQGAANRKGEVWWKRLWVVQEFSCARKPPTVYLGPHAISWAFFAQLMHTDTHNRLTLFESLREQGDQSLMRLIFHAQNFQCTDPKDRIYALLGLSKDLAGGSPIVPDYNKSVRQVFEEATLHMIQEENNMDVLLDERPDRFDSEFPTWVPSFTLLRERESVRTVDKFAAGHADEDIGPDVSFVDRPDGNLRSPKRMLKMRALCFDTIVARTTERSILAPDYKARGKVPDASRPALSSDQPLQLLRCILEQLKVDFSRPALYKLDREPRLGYLMLEYLSSGTRSVINDLEEASAYAPTAERLKRGKVHLEKVAQAFGIDLSRVVKDDWLVAALCESPFLWTRHTRYSYAPDEYWEPIWAQAGGALGYNRTIKNNKRDFFSTSNGFIGLGPANLEVGDEIVVPFGASRPFVLRKSELSGYYNLVGDAVVPGIMAGQLINLWKEGQLTPMDYYLM